MPKPLTPKPLTAEEARIVSSVLAPTPDRIIKWAEINSGTGNLPGLASMARVLREAFGVLPGKMSLHDPAPAPSVMADGSLKPRENGAHLVIRVRPQAPRRILLTGHMDTVFGPNHPFQTCGFLDANRLNGPGVADMKGGLAIMLAGLTAFEQSTPALGYDILINSDEETGSLSSAALIRQLSKGKLAALTFEPALPNGAMARARPGSGNFSAIITGRSAHAGRNPTEGRNAIVAASDLALRLSRLTRPDLLINPAKMDGGGPNNLVPDKAVLHFNIRPKGPDEAGDASQLLDTLLAEIAKEHDVQIRKHGHFNRPPKPITPAIQSLFDLVQQAASDLGQPLSWQDTGGVCDGNNIAAERVPVIDTMGAPGGAIHSADEFLLIDSLATRAQLTALVLHRLNREVA